MDGRSTSTMELHKLACADCSACYLHHMHDRTDQDRRGSVSNSAYGSGDQGTVTPTDWLSLQCFTATSSTFGTLSVSCTDAGASVKGSRLKRKKRSPHVG